MFDFMQYEIRCPLCAHLFYQGAGWLLQHPEFPCPEDCGEIISSPIVDLSVFVPASVRSSNDVDLSEWKPKKAPVVRHYRSGTVLAWKRL